MLPSRRFRSRARGRPLVAAAAAALTTIPSPLAAQGTPAPPDAEALAARLADLRRAHPELVEVRELTRSAAGRPVPLVRLGRGPDVDDRPAVLLVAGTGAHPAGTSVALGVLERLADAAEAADDSAARALLSRTTLYVLPRVSPDAASGWVTAPRRARIRDGAPFDDDRDEAVDEDPPDDLDGDGLITVMRVADATGDWMPDPDDPELMRPVDRARGERGAWRLLPEGVDDDGDGRWNEDPAGGAAFDRSFPIGGDPFGEATGPYPVWTPESRAVAELLVEAPRIGTVWVLGAADNLRAAWEADRDDAKEADESEERPRRPLGGVLADDAPVFAELARRWRRATGLEAEAGAREAGGDLLHYAYFGLGRWAVGSPPWSIPPAGEAEEGGPGKRAETPDAPGAETPDGPAAEADRKPGDADDPIAADRRALHWLRERGVTAVAPWTAVEHPDFPGRTVEVGGFVPGAREIPPADALADLSRAHEAFARELLGALPRLALPEVEVERTGERSWRITAVVADEGYLPTAAAHGARMRWSPPVRIRLETEAGTVAGGREFQMVDRLEGSGGASELTWLVLAGPGSRVTLEAESPAAGRARRTVTLR